MASADSPQAHPTIFDQLCVLCTRMFDGTFYWEEDSWKTHRDIYSLSKVAGQGCHICSLILASIPPEVVEHLQHDIDDSLEPFDQIAVNIRLSSHRLDIYARTPSPPPYSWRDLLHRNHRSIASLSIQRDVDDYTEHDRVPSIISYSASTVAQIKRWLGDCIATHSGCLSMQSAAATRDILPTRLLDLKDVGSHGVLRLVATKGLPQVTIYATLSHCWGGKCGLTLTVDSVPTMEAGILFACLPQTFRDAVSVALDLNIRYLWIDALCIVQDSVDDSDWSHEASIMGDVYANSYITLAATTSPNSTGGLLHQRSPLAVWPCKVTASWNCFDRGNYVIAIPELVRDHNQKPLIDRAWAYQEWLLSKRLLHFSDDQVRWQCYCLSASEVYPNGLDKHDLEYQGTQTKGIVSELRSNQENRLELWERIRIEYSEKSLTKPSDRLAAFSGIARMAHKVLESPPDDYLAGLWKPELLRELLWTRYGYENQPRSKDLYIAPTWSWASLNGSFWQRRPLWSNSQLTPLAMVKDVKVVPVDDAFGPLHTANLTLQCSLSSVTLSSGTGLPTDQEFSGKDRNRGADYDWTVSSIRYTSTTIRCVLEMDYRPITPIDHLTTLSFSYLPILYETDDDREDGVVSGLLLRRASSSQEEYIRVGVLDLYLDANQHEVLEILNLRGYWGHRGVRWIVSGHDVVKII